MYTCDDIAKEDDCRGVECEHKCFADQDHGDEECTHDLIGVARDSGTDAWDEELDDAKAV